MCGIIGVVGNNNTKNILIKSLEKLEYRGYDSAGIFITDDADTFLVKCPGSVEELKSLAKNIPNGKTGIGQHTENPIEKMLILINLKVNFFVSYIMV